MTGSGPARRLSLVVTSELVLVAETVAAGLVASGFDATTIAWPTDEGQHSWQAVSPSGQVGLLISDFDSWERIRTGWLLITGVPLRWVVLTAAPPGPMWGAVLDAGACIVLPSSTGLKQVCEDIAGAAGGTVQTDRDAQESLVGLWAELLERRDVVSQQVGSLTPREHEVLAMLHAGDHTARIAQLLGVSPVTVRSQVTSVLRKLEVNSQLGAVAALDDLLALEPWPVSPASTGG